MHRMRGLCPMGQGDSGVGLLQDRRRMGLAILLVDPVSDQHRLVIMLVINLLTASLCMPCATDSVSGGSCS